MATPHLTRDQRQTIDRLGRESFAAYCLDCQQDPEDFIKMMGSALRSEAQAILANVQIRSKKEVQYYERCVQEKDDWRLITTVQDKAASVQVASVVKGVAWELVNAKYLQSLSQKMGILPF